MPQIIKQTVGKKEVYVRLDDENSEFEGYKNKLPKGYEPKIKVFYGKENKRLR